LKPVEDDIFVVMPSLPLDGEEPVFRAPWEAQAFALAVALHEKGLFSWKEWAAEFGVLIAEDAGKSAPEDYYHLWLDALERMVTRKSLVTVTEMVTRHEQWEKAAAVTPHGKPILLSAGSDVRQD
jgi:nitrile hydratase accessory protein